MKPIILFAGALMLASFSSAALAATPQAGWFVPQLTAGDTTECAPMLARVREQFAGTDPWAAYSEEPLGEDVQGMHAIPREYVNEATRQAAIGTRQVKIERVPGCGGACEGQTITVLVDGKAALTTPKATWWVEYTDGKTRDYFVGFTGNNLEVYAVAGSTALSCRIALEPDLTKMTDLDVLTALQAVDRLNQASQDMSRGGGDCGSARTSWRWGDNITQALHQALYRPWALTPRGNPTSANSYGDYDRIMPQLEIWSLGGFSEQAALQLYKDRIAATEKLLAGFYVKRFGWQEPEAQSMAHSALSNAISSGFGFYSYKPFLDDDEIALRKALLRHAPMTEIQAIPLAVQTLETRPRDWGNYWTDSLLNVAIKYPQALKYLLDKGFDPNRANSFGKMPLMYAAQYNQFEAARILLKAGADPNARTTRPSSIACGFSLSTTNMTPLHYAVRNAGTPLIRLLLQSGAATFIRAHKEARDGSKLDDTPRDWLHRYTNGEGEQNPNLTTQDTAALETELAPPDPGALSSFAEAKVLQAEKQVAAGDAEAAYQLIVMALEADPANQKALADQPLLALKTDRAGEAAAAATKATTDLKSDTDKASAWFNLGLACQNKPAFGGLMYEGINYCEADLIYPFLRAWQIAPSSGRTNKLLALMGREAGDGQACTVDGRSYRVFTAFQDHKYKRRVYVLHRTGETIDPKSISWTVREADKSTTIRSPDLAASHVLGSQSLSVLEGQPYGSPATINGQTCER